MASSIDDKNSTALLIRRLRTEQKWSQQQLALKAGVSFSFVNQVERGKQTVRLDAINKILKVFGYTMSPQLLDYLPKSPRVISAETKVEPEANKARQNNDWAFFK